MSAKVKCPICKGTGHIDPPKFGNRKQYSAQLSSIAKQLRKDGYSIRKIAEMMGFDHPGSISHLLKSKP